MPLRLTFAFLLLLSSATIFRAQSDPDLHAELMEQIELRNTKGVLVLLAELRDRDPVRFVEGGYAYLAGRTAESSGDLGSAASSYQEASQRNSPLRSYALWRLSKIMRRSGNLMAERLFLLEAVSAEDSAASFAAAMRLPRSAYESRDGTLANALNGRGGFADGGNTLSREDLLLTARALRMNGSAEDSESAYRQVLDTTPDSGSPDDLALGAVEGLDRLATGDADYGRTVPELSAKSHFERASVYQFNRRFHEARLHFSAIAERFPEDDLAPESLLQIGRGYVQERDYHNAIEWFERAQDIAPGSVQAEDALYQEAGAYASVGKKRESSSRFEKFIDEHSESELVPGAYLNLVDLYRDSGEPGEALKWRKRMLDAYPVGPERAAALFAGARIHLSQNDWAGALRELDLLRKSGRGTGIRGEADFLRGYALEKLERFSEAIDAYLAIEYGRGNYYGIRATERIRALGDSQMAGSEIKGRFRALAESADGFLESGEADKARRSATDAFRLAASKKEQDEMLALLSRAYRISPGYEVPRQEQAATVSGKETGIAARLIRLGIFDEGAVERELEMSSEARSLGPLSPDEQRSLAELYRRGGLVSRSLELSEQRWKGKPRDFLIELMPRPELESLYPAPFKDHLKKYCGSEGVDPRYALAIMRRESRFDPGVKSSAAARGLMQFIASTADSTAKSLAIEDLTHDDLYEPATSIRLGCRYLADLFRLFPSQFPAVAASYNAGEDRMMRWYRRSHSSEPDRYMPEIRFEQTREYVYRVLAAQRIYAMLYDNELTANGRFD